MFLQFSSEQCGSCNHHKEMVAVGRIVMDVSAVMKLANVGEGGTLNECGLIM
jgi:hypothetical protein